MKRLLPFAIILLVFGAALAFGFRVWNSTENKAAESPAKSSTSVEPAPVLGAQPPHVRGPEDARVTLEEFGDFECPACAKFYPIWKSLEGEYGKRVRVIFRHFPLPLHKRALTAAYVSEAAGLQGKFWQMHDKLFENRDTWSRATDLEPIFLTYARELGLDPDRVKQDLNNDTVRDRVKKDFNRGRSLKIKATPTLYLNGIEIPYRDLKTIDEFRRILDDALKQNGPKS